MNGGKKILYNNLHTNKLKCQKQKTNEPFERKYN